MDLREMTLLRWCIPILAALLLLSACTQRPALSGKVTIQAGDSLAPWIYLVDPLGFEGIGASFRGRVIDSAAIADDGTFRFNALPDAPEPVLLELAVQKAGERFPNKLDNTDPDRANFFPLVWQNNTPIRITADAAHFQQSLEIGDPTPANAAMLELRNTRLNAWKTWMAGAGPESHEDGRLLEEEAALLHYQQALFDFATETDFLLPALTAVRWASPEHNYERIPELLVSQCRKWRSIAPDNPWVVQLCNVADKEKLPVLTGDTIPDVPLPLLSGDTIPLHQLLGDRLTLLDLWASWCAPCRKENRTVLVPAWEAHRDDGFTIIGYALDGSRDVLERAIQKDGAGRWLQASHLQGDVSPFFDALRITTIPANFLLDADGKVLAKNLHGDALWEYIDAFLNER